MTPFRESYCTARRCRAADFAGALFWRCLHPHAVPLAPLLMIVRPEYFAADRDLIARAARARTKQELEEEITEFVHDTRNLGWWRKRLLVRLSTRRLRRVARPFLAEAPALR